MDIFTVVNKMGSTDRNLMTKIYEEIPDIIEK